MFCGAWYWRLFWFGNSYLVQESHRIYIFFCLQKAITIPLFTFEKSFISFPLLFQFLFVFVSCLLFALDEDVILFHFIFSDVIARWMHIVISLCLLVVFVTLHPASHIFHHVSNLALFLAWERNIIHTVNHSDSLSLSLSHSPSLSQYLA